jgi:hypothetical protein
MANVTELATGRINNADTITIELVQADDSSAAVIVKWPDKPTVLQPRRLAEAMATACRVLANASTELSRIKAGKH